MIGSITASSSNRMRAVDRPAWRDLQDWCAGQTLITAKSTAQLDVLSEDGRDIRAIVLRRDSTGRLMGRVGALEKDVVTFRSDVPLPDSVRRHLTSLAEGTPP